MTFRLRRRWSCLFPALCLNALGATTAWATGETMVRHPTFSSIPCAGNLTEIRTEEGNVYNAFEQVVLICADSALHAQWVVEASAGCDTDVDEGNTLEKACAKPEGAPVDKFVMQPKPTPNTNVYMLGRYVFASDCAQAYTMVKRMEAVTNKVRYTETLSGWVCKQINKVDSLQTTDLSTGAVIGARNFRYARIITRGSEEQMDNDAQSLGTVIFGVDGADYAYQVSFRNGKLTVK